MKVVTAFFTGNRMDRTRLVLDLGENRNLKMLVAYVDGGSRGNPGPAGYGVYILDENGNELGSLFKNLGIQTNNFAEYSGLIAALNYASTNNFKRVRIFSDSELMVRQINGIYRVKSPILSGLFEKAKSLIGELDDFSMAHIPRNRNKEADRFANLAMNSPTQK